MTGRIHHGSGIVNVSWEVGSDKRRVEVRGPTPKHPAEAHLWSLVQFEETDDEHTIECTWNVGRSEASQDIHSTDLRQLARELLRMADRLDGIQVQEDRSDPLLNDFLSVFDPKKG